MNKEIQIVKELKPVEDFCKITTVGLEIKEETKIEDWLKIGDGLKRMNGAMQWWIGDWLNYGEQKYGEMYAQALDKTDYDYDTLRKLKQVSERIQFGNRFPNLPWTHHLIVAYLEQDQQKEWLQKAMDNEWSVKELKEAIREKGIEKPKELDNPPIISCASYKDWLPKQPQCDLLLTDPPYSTDVDNIEEFVNEWLLLALNKVKDTGRAYIFIGAYPDELKAYLNVKTPDHLKLENILIWTYKNTLGPNPKLNYIQNYQDILYYKGINAPDLNSNILMEKISVHEMIHPARSRDRYHSWQKPDQLAEMFVRHATKEGEIVLDPFTCTGTFILAANRFGRKGYGCDISKETLKLAIQRGCKYE